MSEAWRSHNTDGLEFRDQRAECRGKGSRDGVVVWSSGLVAQRRTVRTPDSAEFRDQNAEAERKGIERSRDRGIECEEQGEEHDSNRSQRSEVRAQNAELRTGTMDEKTRVRAVDWHSSICNIAHISWPHERRPNFPIPNTIAPIPFPTPPMPPPWLGHGQVKIEVEVEFELLRDEHQAE